MNEPSAMGGVKGVGLVVCALTGKFNRTRDIQNKKNVFRLKVVIGRIVWRKDKQKQFGKKWLENIMWDF